MLYTHLIKMDNQQGPGQCYVVAWMQGESGGEGIHVYV